MRLPVLILALVFAALRPAAGSALPDALAPLAAAVAPGAPLAPGDGLELARRHLAAVPTDVEAWRYAGLQLLALDRAAEAEDAFARAGDAVGRAAALIRQDRLEAARRVVEGNAIAAATAMELAGRVGLARGILAAALAERPGDVALLARLGALELADRRPLAALAPLTRGAELAPPGAPVRRLEVEALLAAGLPVRAHAQAEVARRAGLDGDEGLLLVDLAALQAFGDHRAAIGLAEDHLGRRAASAPVLRALATSLDHIGGRSRAEDARRKADGLAPAPAPAAADAPLAEAGRLEAAGDAGGARTVLGQAAAGLPGTLAGQRSRLLLARARLADTIGAALDDIEAARPGAALADLAAARHAAFAKAGRWPEAAAEAWSRARLRPDERAAAEALLAPETGRRLGWALVFGHLEELVARNPDDADRRLFALEANAAPPGSSVMALVHAHALDRLLPPEDPRSASGHRLRRQVLDRLQRIGAVAEFDPAAGRLALDGAGGSRLEVVVRTGSGRLTRIATPGRWIEARWDATGTRLQGIANSFGDRLELRWRGDRLAGLAAEGRWQFQAELRPDGTVARLEAPDPQRALRAYNAAVALVEAWPATDVDGARGLNFGE
ncbi:hypothetical protein [Magnetospirillum sp. UT-4]|uniref:hypothetical protein n=1 Tax=Magnetospirillum sp. UT-4 TaxID=2681467 RepID=UPI00137CDB9A|nr:hypothetical protein [Magnetospirillum sp. UT-4]CAA7613212.1 exported hypothetical protein [Magnetospirillum sp. UT-4]